METQIAIFNPKEVAKSGAEVFGFILEHEARKQAAEEELNSALNRDETIDAQLIRAAMFLHEEEEIDLYQIFAGDKNATQMLMRSILVKLGVMTRGEKETAEGITYTYEYTNDTLKAAYDYATVDKKEQEAEWKQIHNRVNMRNTRLTRVIKSAVAMVDARASYNDIVVETNEETSQTEVVLNNAPKAIAGTEKRVVLSGRGSTKNEGATVTPTVTGLAKIASTTHAAKPADETSKQDAESTDRPAGDGRMTEDDMLASCNMMVMAIKGREGEFSKAEKTALANLAAEIGKITA